MLEDDLYTTHTTYRPGRLEQGWMLEALIDWLEDGTLRDILYPVRGGKEANVYCCRGGPSTGDALVAAKIYRPRKFRELSNDAIYREGRGLLDAQGHAIRARDRRMARAVRKGSRAGKAATHTSWVMHEFAALTTLHAVGAAVPAPIDANPNAVLTAFIGDEDGAAPTLDRVRLDPEPAAVLLAEALRNIELMLAHDMVHGDLSPYNLLLWEGRLVLIDFPQVSDVLRNPHALGLLVRDIERVCEGFRRIGARVELDPREVADDMWDRVFDTDTGVPDEAIALAR